jgi:SOS regulatory protein LexA
MKNLDGENKYKVINYKNLKASEDVINNKALIEKSSIEEKESLNAEIQQGENIMKTEVVDKNLQKKSNVDLFMDYFDYCDLKHNKSYSFAVDTSNINEVILNPNEDNEVISEDELKLVPVYSDIAAGEPILISDEFEGTFNIPNYWLKGVKDAFMLRVKGDSMIGANIHHGDYVLIKKQSIANNKDIVAVDLDGNATLKRLSIEKNGIFLVPENPKYDPIKVQSEGAMIIGTAIGVIKRR